MLQILPLFIPKSPLHSLCEHPTHLLMVLRFGLVLLSHRVCVHRSLKLYANFSMPVLSRRQHRLPRRLLPLIFEKGTTEKETQKAKKAIFLALPLLLTLKIYSRSIFCNGLKTVQEQHLLRCWLPRSAVEGPVCAL